MKYIDKYILFIIFICLCTSCQEAPARKTIGIADAVALDGNTLILYGVKDYDVNQTISEEHSHLLHIRALGNDSDIKESVLVLGHAMTSYKLQKPMNGQKIPLLYRVTFEVWQSGALNYSTSDVSYIQVVGKKDSITSASRYFLSSEEDN